MSAAEELARVFSEKFYSSEIPEENIRERRRGKIRRPGFLLRYLFGEDDRGEYLDLYMDSRHSGYAHERLRPDGSVEPLEEPLAFRRASDDPEEDARCAKEYREQNRRADRALRKKGFL